MKISDIIHEAHATAVAKGWHERPACTERGSVTRDAHGNVTDFVMPRGVDVTLVGSWLALIHTELGEAWDEYGAHKRGLNYDGEKPCGLLSELADVVIRICDVSGALSLAPRAGGIDAACETIEHLHGSMNWTMSNCGLWTPETLMLELRYYVDCAVEELRKLDWLEVCETIGHLIAYCCEFVRLYSDHSMTLTEAVRVKMNYNRTRPHRHGGKAL